MRPALLLLFVLTAGAFAQNPVPAEKWKSYKTKSGKLTVLLPGKPKETTEKSKDGTTDTLTVDAGSTAYIAAETMFGRSLSDANDAERILDGSENGLVTSMKAVLATKQSVTIEGLPGRRIRYTFASDGSNMAGESLLVFAGDRLFHVMVVSETPGPNQEDAARYIGSVGFNGTKFAGALNADDSDKPDTGKKKK